MDRKALNAWRRFGRRASARTGVGRVGRRAGAFVGVDRVGRSVSERAAVARHVRRFDARATAGHRAGERTGVGRRVGERAGFARHGRGLGAVVGVVGLAGAAAMALAVAAPPAAAHTRLVGSEPAAGEVLPTPPATVTLHLAAKPATLEGDPVQVLAPDGVRVDSGRPGTSGDGRRVTVRLRGGPLPAGGYHVLYRVVSGDSHLIIGRLDFWATDAGWPDGPAPARPALTHVALGEQQRLVLGGAGAAAVLAMVVPRRRRHGARHA